MVTFGHPHYSSEAFLGQIIRIGRPQCGQALFITKRAERSGASDILSFVCDEG